jgi:beta-lactamase regulating signal transducer with metallopeptidase domain
MNPDQIMLLKTSTVDYLFNSIWQLPLIFAAAWLAARLARRMGPAGQHRIWIAAMLAEAILPACRFNAIEFLREAWALLPVHRIAADGQTRILVGAPAAIPSGLHLPSAFVDVMLFAYPLAVLYAAIRLFWGLSKTRQLAIHSQSLPVSPMLQNKLDRYAAYFHLHGATGRQPVHLATSEAVASPVTFGIRRHTLLLPKPFLASLSGTDLEALLAHECAHMRRRDFAKNILYEILALPIAYHPILWITNARLSETRELVCDRLAAGAIGGREPYAHALLRLAALISTQAPNQTLHAIGIFDANIFERRIMQLIQKPAQVKRSQRIAILAATIFLALATGFSALALHTTVAPEEQPKNPKYIQVKIDSMKVVSRVTPVYPKAAKEKLKVVSGPKELQQSAIEAVSHWKWEPYLLNGEPTEVETTVTVIYSLAR